MFTKPKGNETKNDKQGASSGSSDIQGSSVPKPVPMSDSAPKPKAAPSILSSDLNVQGNLLTDGDIQIEGEVEGNIKASLLTVGQNAKIKGEINTNELIINGFVSGTIRSKKVTLTSSAKVEGDIIHNTIAIETGAHFEGSIEKTDNPLSKSDLKNGKLIN